MDSQTSWFNSKSLVLTECAFMRHLIYGIKYLTQYWLLGKQKPLICGLVLHNKCNLKCEHCTVIERDTSTMSFAESIKVMNTFYTEGGRCLYLEGGEPLLWNDKSHTVKDIVEYAKTKGYFAVIIYTNGTLPLNSKADTIFVSVDGMQKTHDKLRGKSFEKIMNNIKSSNHSSIYVNYTINSINKNEIEEFCSYISFIKQIKGIFFYFHTPYYGYDELFIDKSSRIIILEKIIQLKSKYKILNSISGLKTSINNNWKKKLDICIVYEDGNYYNCCRESNNISLCEECGYLSYAEIDQTLKLKPGAIMNALKYF